jgi:hypothetical protein
MIKMDALGTQLTRAGGSWRLKEWVQQTLAELKYWLGCRISDAENVARRLDQVDQWWVDAVEFWKVAKKRLSSKGKLNVSARAAAFVSSACVSGCEIIHFMVDMISKELFIGMSVLIA